MDKLSKYFFWGFLALPIVPVLTLSYSFLRLPQNHSMVVVDKARIFSEYVRALSQYPLDEQRISQETTRFRLVFQKTLQTYASTHHVVIVDKKEVLALSEHDSIEVTDSIMHALQQSMRVTP